MTPPLHFTVRARGVPGEGKRDPIEAAWQPGRLALRGPAGGGLDLSYDAVSRLRLGYERTKYSTFYTAWIWHVGGAEPVMMTAEERSAPAYGMAMRALARDVADRQGLDRIERGLSVAGALSWPIAALVIGLVFSAMALTVWADRGRVGQIAMILVCAGVFAAILVRALMVDMPRAVRSLDELERYLPRAMGGSA